MGPILTIYVAHHFQDTVGMLWFALRERSLGLYFIPAQTTKMSYIGDTIYVEARLIAVYYFSCIIAETDALKLVKPMAPDGDDAYDSCD